jgi:hypothetical protein
MQTLSLETTILTQGGIMSKQSPAAAEARGEWETDEADQCKARSPATDVRAYFVTTGADLRLRCCEGNRSHKPNDMFSG